MGADPAQVGQPAPTTWKKMPALPPVPVPPSVVPPLPAPPSPYRPLQPADAPSGTVPGRTVTYQKPPGTDTTIPNVAPIPVPNANVLTVTPQLPSAADAKIPGKFDLPKPAPELAETLKSIDKIDTTSLPPALDRSNVFRMQSDSAFKKRVTSELIEIERKKPRTEGAKFDPVQTTKTYSNFPKIDPLAPEGAVYQPKTITQNYQPMQARIEPGYVVHRRLYFEEKNSERYGWEVGFFQPALSGLAFYKDVLLYPAHFGSNLFERYDTSAGKCLPGSPVPYYLYPEEIDLFGATFGAATIVGAAFAVFP
jgi:hypothetical protein